MVNNTCTDLDKLVEIDPSVQGLGVFIAYTISWGNPPVQNPFTNVIEELIDRIRRTHSLEKLRENPVVRAYRDFYWRIGIDPTKTRPSGEALVRRILRGRFPVIHPIVDAGNIASAETLVPIGIYDLDKAKPPLKLALSGGGEEFKPIGGKPEKLDPGIPILVDSGGIVLHLYPHRDSELTAVSSSTSRVLIIGAGVPGVQQGLVRKAVERVVELLGMLGWSSCEEIVVKP
ncbi:MAG: phenylalanine--tRNA ligase beta subunit-related protein [Thermoprotei archaeon]